MSATSSATRRSRLRSAALIPLVVATEQAVGDIDEITTDSGFDGDKQRAFCLGYGILPVITNRPNRLESWEIDRESYDQRNRVEWLIGKVKQFRRVATRSEKRKATYRAFPHLAFGFVRLRKIASNGDTTWTKVEQARISRQRAAMESYCPLPERILFTHLKGKRLDLT